jgi:hypothetical protein
MDQGDLLREKVLGALASLETLGEHVFYVGACDRGLPSELERISRVYGKDMKKFTR